MEFEEAKNKTLNFFKNEFGMWNLEIFLERNMKEKYTEFKKRFINRYGPELLKRIDAKTLKNLGGRVKDIFEANNLEDLYIRIDQCAEIFTHNYKVVNGDDIVMAYSNIASHVYSFSSELEQKVRLAELKNPEKKLYRLLGSCLNNGHDKDILDEAGRLCRQVFYGQHKVIDNQPLRLAYRALISDLSAGKDGKEKYDKITALRLSLKQ